MFAQRLLRPDWRALIVVGVIGAGPAAEAQIVLSDNLAQATADVEAASGDRWLAASFGTSSTTTLLSSATLLLANPTAGAATLRLYDDGGLQPGSLVAQLISPASYSTTLAEATFAASGVTLEADSTYWLVLAAGSGEFEWAWTIDNEGSGDGFQHTWGDSPDAGESWFTVDVYPLQFSVTAGEITGDFDGDGSVDATDLAAWSGGFGASGGAAHVQGDADGDLDVDGADFLTWQQQLGAGGSSAQLLGGAVPEPAGAAAMSAATLALLARRRRRLAKRCAVSR